MKKRMKARYFRCNIDSIVNVMSKNCTIIVAVGIFVGIKKNVSRGNI